MDLCQDMKLEQLRRYFHGELSLICLGVCVHGCEVSKIISVMIICQEPL